MAHDNAGSQEKVSQLQAENERLRSELARIKADRDQYRRELFLAFPPPDYTDEEIADFINDRQPANGLIEEIKKIVREHGK